MEPIRFRLQELVAEPGQNIKFQKSFDNWPLTATSVVLQRPIRLRLSEIYSSPIVKGGAAYPCRLDAGVGRCRCPGTAKDELSQND